jgi:hypothetical protein
VSPVEPVEVAAPIRCASFRPGCKKSREAAGPFKLENPGALELSPGAFRLSDEDSSALIFA